MNKKKYTGAVLLVTTALLLAHTASADEVLEFEMADVYGRVVSSQDYKGVPVFLEFGACW